VGQAWCLNGLARLFYKNKQLDAAEEAASRAINLLPEKDEHFEVCQCHRVLGDIYRSKGETEKAVDHLGVALGIACSFNWHDQLFWTCYSLAQLFSDQGMFDNAHAHIERAKSHAVNNAYYLGRAMHRQAYFWYKQGRLEQAKSGGLRAAGVFEKLGAALDLERCRELLQRIDEKLGGPAASDELDFNGEPLETVLPVVFINSPCSDGIIESE